MLVFFFLFFLPSVFTTPPRDSLQDITETNHVPGRECVRNLSTVFGRLPVSQQNSALACTVQKYLSNGQECYGSRDCLTDPMAPSQAYAVDACRFSAGLSPGLGLTSAVSYDGRQPEGNCVSGLSRFPDDLCRGPTQANLSCHTPLQPLQYVKQESYCIPLSQSLPRPVVHAGQPFWQQQMSKLNDSAAYATGCMLPDLSSEKSYRLASFPDQVLSSNCMTAIGRQIPPTCSKLDMQLHTFHQNALSRRKSSISNVEAKLSLETLDLFKPNKNKSRSGSKKSSPSASSSSSKSAVASDTASSSSNMKSGKGTGEQPSLDPESACTEGEIVLGSHQASSSPHGEQEQGLVSPQPVVLEKPTQEEALGLGVLQDLQANQNQDPKQQGSGLPLSASPKLPDHAQEISRLPTQQNLPVNEQQFDIPMQGMTEASMQAWQDSPGHSQQAARAHVTTSPAGLSSPAVACPPSAGGAHLSQESATHPVVTSPDQTTGLAHPALVSSHLVPGTENTSLGSIPPQFLRHPQSQQILPNLSGHLQPLAGPQQQPMHPNSPASVSISSLPWLQSFVRSYYRCGGVAHDFGLQTFLKYYFSSSKST